jgi:hypothetical protein
MPPAPPAAPARVRRGRGCLAGSPGAGCPPAPGGLRGPPWEPRQASGPWGLTPGLPGTWWGPLGCLAAPASAAILGTAAKLRLPAWCGPRGQTPQARATMCLSAVSGSTTLLPLRRKRSQRASWISGHPALFPGAGRLHVGCRMAPSTSRRSKRRPYYIRQPPRPGDKFRRQILSHPPTALPRSKRAAPVGVRPRGSDPVGGVGCNRASACIAPSGPAMGGAGSGQRGSRCNALRLLHPTGRALPRHPRTAPRRCRRGG